MKYLGLCAIVKDEDPFLEEWICHHALLGVEGFIIFGTNGQTLYDQARRTLKASLTAAA